MVTDKYTSTITGMGNDEMLGRWSYVEILGKHGRKIMLVTVYNVCNQQNKKAGARTAHTQQVSLLTRQGRKISPRKASLHAIDIQNA